jgi:hypothetical protein
MTSAKDYLLLMQLTVHVYKYKIQLKSQARLLHVKIIVIWFLLQILQEVDDHIID